MHTPTSQVTFTRTEMGNALSVSFGIETTHPAIQLTFDTFDGGPTYSRDDFGALVEELNSAIISICVHRVLTKMQDLLTDEEFADVARDGSLARSIARALTEVEATINGRKA